MEEIWIRLVPGLPLRSDPSRSETGTRQYRQEFSDLLVGNWIIRSSPQSGIIQGFCRVLDTVSIPLLIYQVKFLPTYYFDFLTFKNQQKNALLVVGRQWHRKMIMKSKDPVPVGWRALDSSWQHCCRTVDGVGEVVKLHYTHDLLRDNNIDHFYFRHRPVHTWLWCVLCLNIKNISTRHPEVSVQRHGCIRYAI